MLALYRHVHFELSSILRELNTIFGLQTVMQVAMLHLVAVHFVIQFYRNITSVKTHLTYITIVDILCIFMWTVRCIIDVIVFNHTCEIACAKVNFENICKELCKRDKCFTLKRWMIVD